MPQAVETWCITKPAVHSEQGLVASQHRLASVVGAKVLEDGGNAVDAAVAAGVAIGTVEPWMSGLGGGGFMLVYVAAEQRTYAIDFSMRAPGSLNPADFPLAEGQDADLFAWPAVVEDRNVHGPLSVAVPGFVAGHALALNRFGTLDWAEALAPAIALAGQGIEVDWYATLKIASEAPILSRYPATANIYLRDGFVPAGAWGGLLPKIHLANLERTLRRLAEAGPDDFYRGEIGAAICAELIALGGCLQPNDLYHYHASVNAAQSCVYRGARVDVAPGLNGGPSLQRALALLQDQWTPGTNPDAEASLAYGGVLEKTYEERLANMGSDGEVTQPSCTTHLGVVDKDGNMVALTQTLLSVFGSKVMLGDTGVLMNNGIMWFDPRPGRVNSLAPGKRPLSNMCPALVDLGDGTRVALGASGGRRIMPAVFQLCSFLIDYSMGVEEACHQPRIDVSGTPKVSVDAALEDTIINALAAHHDTLVAPHGVYPALFACPNVVARNDMTRRATGGAFIMSPWAEAVAAGYPSASHCATRLEK